MRWEGGRRCLLSGPSKPLLSSAPPLTFLSLLVAPRCCCRLRGTVKEQAAKLRAGKGQELRPVVANVSGGCWAGQWKGGVAS